MAHETERLPAFWDGMSCQGMRVAIIDVPKCRRPTALNGTHVVDWLIHGEYFSSPASYPGHITHELLESYGSRPSHLCTEDALQPGGGIPQQLVANAKREVAMKLAAGRHYLSAHARDLFCIGFSRISTASLFC